MSDIATAVEWATDHVAMARRNARVRGDVPVAAEHIAVLIAGIAALTAERDAALDLAFRAAFADEEGASIEWGAQHVGFDSPFVCRTERLARDDAERSGGDVVQRVLGAWKPVRP